MASAPPADGRVDDPGDHGAAPLRWLGDQLAVVVAAVLLTLGLRACVIEGFLIPSESMLPTLRSGDHVFAAKWVFGTRLPFTDARLPATREPKRGEVVIFEVGRRGPEIAPRDERPDLPVERLVKRVVGLPGDRVESWGGRLVVNGVPVDAWATGEIWVDASGRRLEGWSESFHSREHRLLRDPAQPTPDFVHDVPEGRYFVMGDHRDHSSGDSRFLGTVPRGDLIGPVAFVYWSWDLEGEGLGWAPSSWWKALERTRWQRVGEVIQ